MLFCTSRYFVFLVLVFAVYWALPWRRARVWLLLGASFYFYASWSRELALLVFGTTVVDYLIGRGMAATARQGYRRLLLIGSLAMNLGILCYFKYANFFLASLEQALHAAGASASLPVLSVLLPIGISFYTFEAISYTVDVYRRKIPAERNLDHFLLFITFFPHLVAGPIVRAGDFLPQVGRRKRFDWTRLQIGVQLLLLGMFKKLVLADRMALFVDPVFEEPGLYGTYATWLAMLAYAVQVYCDFSGYSDMALGSAHLLGYHLAINFNMPYLSANVSEFWRRWHISLSSWLRDYLYIPLGGSKGSEWRTAGNLILTMTICGLWHGPAWNYIGFGFCHGLLLVGHRLFRRAAPAWPALDRALISLPGTAGRIAFTFLGVAASMVIFRAQTWEACVTVYRHLIWSGGGLGPPVHDSSFWWLFLVLVVGHALGAARVWEWDYRRLPAPVLGFGYALVLSLTLLFNLDLGKAFVYFQF